MRAKIDENMPVDAVRLFVEAGWDTSAVHDEHLVGAGDQRLIETCQREGRVLFSLDLDFADIRAYPPEAWSGIVVLRAGSAAVVDRGATPNTYARHRPRMLPNRSVMRAGTEPTSSGQETNARRTSGPWPSNCPIS